MLGEHYNVVEIGARMYCSHHRCDFVYSDPAHFGCPKCGIYHEFSALIRGTSGLEQEYRMREMCLCILQRANQESKDLFIYRLRNEF